MQEIKNLFERIFAPWQITIEDKELFVGNRRTIADCNNWRIKWVVGNNDKGNYLEYYAINSTRGHLHGRIYENGKEEKLEVLKEYIVYSPTIPGDREKSAQEFEIYNKRLIKYLEEKGLF
ncbi:hypothetical protein [Cellulosilyticum ruminicola]|uniref:hypothetical protein n=1 Tax=Cellulosilyticum ruminicola TaxID=425254 RepID=UPI0006D152F0|nr:hypothetical protein [Cellulosilyticum ruminicola]